MSELCLRRPLAILDLETTGTSPRDDRIVEIAVLKLFPDGSQEVRCRRVNPERLIPAQATEVHGITDSDVAGEPPFRKLAKALFDLLADCDFAGYNIAKFDLPLLQAEFKRVGLDFSWKDCAVVDAMSIFHAKERRDLLAAVKFYCGEEHPKPHSAEQDAVATLSVLRAQLQRYEDLPRDVEGLHAFCHPRGPDWVDAEGKLLWRDGAVCMGFGKHLNAPLAKLAKENPDYLDWLLRGDFSDEVKHLVRSALAGTLGETAP